MSTETYTSHSIEHLSVLVARAQSGDRDALDDVLHQFRPLLRSRMRQAWTILQEQPLGAEWADVEAQLHLSFLTRLRDFDADQGVYFPHYMARMLDLDCRDWLRRLRRGAAVPFSQLGDEDAVDDLHDALAREDEGAPDAASEVEQALSLRAALATLTTAQRQVVWGCCVLGRTESDVAAALGLSRSTVRNRLEGALARLRAFFQARREDVADVELQVAVFATRTGRSTPQTLAMQREFKVGNQRIMATDEKRPDLVGVGAGRPITLQGVFEFEATGLKSPKILSPTLRFVVPAGCVLGVRYFRAGVSCEKMVCLSTVVNGLPHRLVPLAPNSAQHVPFAIVEPLAAGSEIEIHIASEAPGTAIIDVGCLQMPA